MFLKGDTNLNRNRNLLITMFIYFALFVGTCQSIIAQSLKVTLVADTTTNSYYALLPNGKLDLVYQKPIFITKENLMFTTSTTFQDIVNETVNLPAGDYEILLTANENGDATGSDFWIRFLIDGVSASSQSATIHRQESKDIAGNQTTPYSNQSYPILYRSVKTFQAGNHTFNPQIRAEVNGVEAGTFNFVLSIQRIEETLIQN